MKKLLFLSLMIFSGVAFGQETYVKITIVREMGGSATAWVQYDDQDINLNKQDNVKFKTEIEALNYTCKKFNLKVIDFVQDDHLHVEKYICIKELNP